MTSKKTDFVTHWKRIEQLSHLPVGMTV